MAAPDRVEELGVLDLVRDVVREVVREEVRLALAEALPPVLTAEEVAQRYGVTTRAVRGWVAQGRLRAIRLGRTTRIRADELARFEAAHLTGGPRPIDGVAR